MDSVSDNTKEIKRPGDGNESTVYPCDRPRVTGHSDDQRQMMVLNDKRPITLLKTSVLHKGPVKTINFRRQTVLTSNTTLQTTLTSSFRPWFRHEKILRTNP